MNYQTRYTGPNGPNPSKTRGERRAELMQLIGSVDGCEILRNLRRAAEGVPKSVEPFSWRRVKMERYVDAILSVEYSNDPLVSESTPG